jgi:hypothetical protein
MASTGETTQWYWCLQHERPEPEGEQCRAADRLGPYPSREEAIHWQERVEARNEQWKEDDERWEGDDEDGREGVV